MKEYKDGYSVDEYGNFYNKKNIKLRGTITKMGYIQVVIDNKVYLLHRIIAETFYGEIPKDMVVDHINNDKKDNRLENLRIVTKSINAFNCYNTKGYCKWRNKYKAYINCNDKHYYEMFDTIEKCIEWRKNKELELFGFKLKNNN